MFFLTIIKIDYPFKTVSVRSFLINVLQCKKASMMTKKNVENFLLMKKFKIHTKMIEERKVIVTQDMSIKPAHRFS